MRLRFIGILAVLAMIMAFAAAPVGAHDDPSSTNSNHPHFWEHQFPGAECEKLEGEGISGEASWTADADYAVVIVKGGADGSGGGDEVYVDVAAGDELFAPLNPNTEATDDHFEVSHVIVCTMPQASLTIAKDADGNTTESFDFGDFDLVGGGSTTLDFEGTDFVEGSVEVTITESLTEAQDSALWELADITCDVGADVTIDVDAGTLIVTLVDGDDVTCTFFNEQGTAPAVNTPSLTLDKVVTSGDATLAFGFSLNGSAIAGLSANDAPRVISTTAGAHTIVETVPANWTLASVQCTDNATGAVLTTSPVTSGTALTGVTVTVGDNQDVTCTFTNSPQVVLSGNPTPTPSPSQPVRQGTLASSVPNTAMEGASTDQLPVAFLALLALGSLGFAAQRNLTATRNRR